MVNGNEARSSDSTRNGMPIALLCAMVEAEEDRSVIVIAGTSIRVLLDEI